MRKEAKRKKVRIPGGYPTPFCFDLGQRNAEFVSGPLVRGSRVFAWLDSLTFVRAPECELMHTLNAVPIFRRSPYVITFESYLPRVPDDRRIPWLERFLFKYLALPHCKRLIAFSEYALNQFKAQVDRNGGMDGLLQKTEVLYPAVGRRAAKPRRLDMKELSVLFVGRQFMHKGGPAVVRAHEQLLLDRIPVRTTIVSTFDWDSKGLVGPGAMTIAKEEQLRTSGRGIEVLRHVPNDEVLRLMDDSDVLVLPTVNDTFGFACIEAMAGGVPVIATNTCAIPEIVEHGKNGFLLDMPVDGSGRWAGLQKRHSAAYDDLYRALMDDLGEQLARLLAGMWQDAEGYRQMSAGALATIDAKFNRDQARGRLEGIYEGALA